MKKYLITGGAGFIGSNFAHYLYKKEPQAKVTVLDKLTYSGSLESLMAFQGRAGFEFIQGDICDEAAVKKAMQDVEVVVHFAAESAVDRSINDPESFLRTDIFGVYMLLQQARRQKNLKRFIQISTDEVYGEILKGSFKETSETKPRNPYAASKLGGERMAFSFFTTYGLPVIISRASNNYGPRAYPEKVIPLFITNLIDDKKIPLYGQGKQIRDWLYVEDHCAAIYFLISKGKDGEVYNVGAGQEYTNLEMTKKVLKLMKKSSSMIEYVTDRPGHDFRYSLDCSKLMRLGWKPKVKFDEGLNKTIDWYKANEAWWRSLKEKMDQRYVNGYWGKKDERHSFSRGNRQTVAAVNERHQ